MMPMTRPAESSETRQVRQDPFAGSASPSAGRSSRRRWSGCRQQFEDRLRRFPAPWGGELGQVDGDHGAHRYGHGQGHGRRDEVPETSTMMPKWASSNSGVHWVSVRKSTMLTFWKNEWTRNEHIDDADGRQHRHGGRGKRMLSMMRSLTWRMAFFQPAVADLFRQVRRYCSHGLGIL